jgi:hypothetical protein
MSQHVKQPCSGVTRNSPECRNEPTEWIFDFPFCGMLFLQVRCSRVKDFFLFLERTSRVVVFRNSQLVA